LPKPQSSKPKQSRLRKPKPKPKLKAKVVTYDSEANAKYENALIALGYNKTEAKRLVKGFFKSNKASNVDEFVEKFFKKKRGFY